MKYLITIIEMKIIESKRYSFQLITDIIKKILLFVLVFYGIKFGLKGYINYDSSAVLIINYVSFIFVFISLLIPSIVTQEYIKLNLLEFFYSLPKPFFVFLILRTFIEILFELVLNVIIIFIL
ncbi:hypothetical protein KAU33_10405 [Candidatus Dependentiae bacterium]|nr:hypothetical protein [Candidatus Dependentiae bacterium]